MKSDIVHITSGGSGIDEAFIHCEKVAVYNELDQKSAIHLRLLTEEMTGMFVAITGEQEADFWIESEDGKYELHLLANTSMDYETRSRLIAATTSGKNDVKGFRAKLRSVFEAAITSMNDGYNEAVSLGLVEYNGVNSFSEWTLSQYKQQAQEEAWDELEQSVVAKLADEVRVSIKGYDVEMIIDKKM
ncbi:MAG: hypothetical protein IJS03_02175 [Eubacterium sp.]|nr:hypothetical protein [Eubacterium sp.]